MSALFSLEIGFRLCPPIGTLSHDLLTDEDARLLSSVDFYPDLRIVSSLISSWAGLRGLH